MEFIRRAAEEDLPDLMRLRIEAEEWLAASGIDQWRDPATRKPALAKWHQDIQLGNTWVVVEGQRTTGTVTLTGPDLDFWTADDVPASALYAAKLITSRAVSGENLGGRLLDFACSRARAQGRPWVRLDCWRDNRKLQAFYLREGFTHVRTEAPAHRKSGWLAQRPSAVLLHPQSLLHELFEESA